MLFAGVFNGSVAESELPKGYVHNYAQDCWLAEDGSSISVNDEVDVQVLRVHVAGGMIAIEATMRVKGASKASPPKKSKKATLDLTAETPNIPEVKSTKTKKAKKRKHAEEAVVVEEEAEEEEVVVKVKKSKHKDKDGKKKKHKKSKHD
ncbi:hypothetical protein BBJ28_00023646 [Nothophytophthora sp. Chile5]|nr:hypothetical protein BBJ28_00023646 [Nothophytophthora sp. Chile5]